MKKCDIARLTCLVYLSTSLLKSLFLVTLCVETLFDHRAVLAAAVYLDLHFRAESGKARVDECHAHALAGRYALIAGGYGADEFLAGVHFVAVARNGAAFEFDAHEFLGLTDDELQGLQTEVIVDITAVDGDGTGAVGEQMDLRRPVP